MVLGIALAALHLRAPGAPRPPLLLRLAHGLAGAAGLAVLAAAGVTMDPFGICAIVLLTAALVVGLGIALFARGRRRGTGLALAVHGSIAIAGYVMLMAFVAAG